MVNGREHICPEFLKVDCVAVAIHKDKNYYLFIIQSFIGNGDGLLYCKDDVHWEEIIDVRINGYEVTGGTQVENNWFYVSFT